MGKRVGGIISPSLAIVLFLVFAKIFGVVWCDKSTAIFIFGDSLNDNGNNNFLPSIARADYYPYGIDIGRPTGRFCNGLTATDFAARHLGIRFPPPYLSLRSLTPLILGGVNYASAAAGILNETGQHYGSRVSFAHQVALFAETVRVQYSLLMPNPDTLSEFLSNSLFVIHIGSNDYINNYLLPDLYPTSANYSRDDFAKMLTDRLQEQLQNLYNLGARKMLVVGLGPLGCIPSQLSSSNTTSGCVEEVNELVKPFNNNLILAVDKLNSTLPGSFFVINNIYDTFLDMIRKPSKYGFSVTNEACCGHGRFGGQLTCLLLQEPCNDRNQYIFWDSFHPTQAVNEIIAARCFSETKGDCFPITGDQLAAL